jgi:uncharacterized phosphosugar-binding protein
MSAERWHEACTGVLEKIGQTQSESITAAATCIADTMAAGGALHFYDNGHCPGEPIGRAGGLFAIHPISYSIGVNHPMPPQHAKKGRIPARDLREDDAKIVAARSKMVEGDCIIIMSVSGKNPFPVELGLQAKARGLKVITITSLAYSKAVKSVHSTGKRLFEVADFVIDNCGIPGDGILEMEGVDTKVAPTSGIAACYIMWAITCELVKNLTGRGLKPSIYKSINMPDGEAFNAEVRKRYEETGI